MFGKQMIRGRSRMKVCGRLMLAVGVVSMVVMATGVRGNEADEAQPPCMATETRRARERMAALPSEPGPHIEKIKEMGDNEWLDLGAPEPDPKWGLRRGTSFTPRMAFAPEMRGAFVFGEGPHAHPRRSDIMTDLYFYDINAHAWICCSPPFQYETQKLRLDANGFEVDETEQPIPYSISHGWQHFTYDSDRRQFLSVHSGCTFSRNLMAERRKEWIGDRQVASSGHPWFWNVLTGRWERRITTGDVPVLHEHNHILEYVPDLNSSFYIATHGRALGVYRYDHDANRWHRLQRPPVRNVRGTACHDTRRGRLYLSGPGMAYDFAEDEWTELAGTETWNEFTGVTRATLTYDSVNDVVVAFRYHMRPGWRDPDNYVRIYDPEEDAWLEEKLEGPPEHGGVAYAQYNAFYDPELNAHFMYAAGDGMLNGTIWVYRYKRAANNDEKEE